MHLTYICQFLRIYTPPHLSSPSQIPISTHPYPQPRRTQPNHANIRISPTRVLRLLKLFCEVKARLWFPSCSRHFAHLPPKSFHRLDIVGILHTPILNPFHFMISRQDTPHLPTSIHNPGLTTTQPYAQQLDRTCVSFTNPEIQIVYGVICNSIQIMRREWPANLLDMSKIPHTDMFGSLSDQNNNSRICCSNIIMNLFHTQVRTFRKCLPLVLGPLFTSKGHHGKIRHGRLPASASSRQHGIIDQDPRVGAHGSTNIAEDRCGFVVGPIMHDSTEVVELGALVKENVSFFILSSRVVSNG